MKKNILFILLITAVLITGCSTTYRNIDSDYDRSADMTAYKSFAWLPDVADSINSPYNNQIIRNNIRNYFSQCMSDRGYTVDLVQPNVLMQLVVTNTKKERVITSNPASYYYRPYYFGSFYYSPYPFYYYSHYSGYNYTGYPGRVVSQKEQYINGSITLNFIDAATRKVIWTVTASGDIYDPGQINRDLHPAIHRMLEQYPVKPLLKRGHKIRR